MSNIGKPCIPKKQKPIYQVCRNVFAIMMLFVVSNDKKCWMITCHMILHQLPRKRCEKIYQKTIWQLWREVCGMYQMMQCLMQFIGSNCSDKHNWNENQTLKSNVFKVLHKFKVSYCQETVIVHWKKNPFFRW